MNNNCSLIKYTDAALWGVLDALIGDQGRVGATEKLGVNYRTLKNCLESRRLTRRMREALEKFVTLAPVVGKPLAVAGGAGSQEGQGKTLAQLMADLEAEIQKLRETGEGLAQRVADRETENRELQETNDTQTAHLKDRDRWIGVLVQGELRSGMLSKIGLSGRRRDRDAIIAGFADPPKPRVITLNHQLGEEKALGPAAPLVAEWREVSWRAATSEVRVERAEAEKRRLEREIELIGDFRLTLPPEKEPLDFSTGQDPCFGRRAALVDAGEEFRKAKGRNARVGD